MDVNELSVDRILPDPNAFQPDSTTEEEEFKNKAANPFWGPWATIGFGVVTAIVFIVTQVVAMLLPGEELPVRGVSWSVA